MNRRGFLSTVLSGAAALTLDPDKDLWVPGRKKIFIPPAPQVHEYDKEIFWLIQRRIDDAYEQLSAILWKHQYDSGMGHYNVKLGKVEYPTYGSIPSRSFNIEGKP